MEREDPSNPYMKKRSSGYGGRGGYDRYDRRGGYDRNDRRGRDYRDDYRDGGRGYRPRSRSPYVIWLAYVLTLISSPAAVDETTMIDMNLAKIVIEIATKLMFRDSAIVSYHSAATVSFPYETSV